MSTKKDTYYCERANGTLEYWFYSEGRRYFTTERHVKREIERGLGRLVRL